MAEFWISPRTTITKLLSSLFQHLITVDGTKQNNFSQSNWNFPFHSSDLFIVYLWEVSSSVYSVMSHWYFKPVARSSQDLLSLRPNKLTFPSCTFCVICPLAEHKIGQSSSKSAEQKAKKTSLHLCTMQ